MFPGWRILGDVKELKSDAQLAPLLFDISNVTVFSSEQCYIEIFPPAEICVLPKKLRYYSEACKALSLGHRVTEG